MSLISPECAYLPTRQVPAFLVSAATVPSTQPSLVSPRWTQRSLGRHVHFLCLRGEGREDRNLCSGNLFFRTETCSGILRFHSTLFIWKESTFFITSPRRNPTLGGNSFQSHVLLALVILAHSGLRSQLGIVGPNRSFAPEMFWNSYKVSREAGD